MTEDLLISRAYIIGQLGLGSPLQILRVNAAGDDLEYASGGGGSADDVGIVLENNVAVNVVARRLNFETSSDFDVTDNAGTGNVDVSIANDAIVTALIANNAVTTDKILNNAITTAKILNDNVTYDKIQNVVSDDVFLGRISGAGGNIEELTGTQATTLLNIFTDALKGLVPASGGGTTNFLRADGTWSAPPGAGGGEANTASNVGAGDGWWKDKVGVDLRFKSIIAASNKFSITANVDDITVDVAEANLTLSNIGGSVTTGQLPSSVILDTESNQITDTLMAAHTSTKITITNKSLLNANIVYTDQTNAFGDFNQDFKDNKLRIQNPAETFYYTLVAGAIAADRTLNLPVLTGTDTIAVLALAQTLTNKTIDANSNVITNINDDEIATHTSTKISITSKSLLNSNIVYNDQTNAFGNFNQDFKDDKLRIQNPAETFYYTLVAGAIAADRTLNLPVLTATDTIAVLALAQTLTNKTINAPDNTITNIGDTNIASHTSTKITITAKGQLNSAIVYTDQANDFGNFDNSFKDDRIRIWNPADTFRYTLAAGAIAADRTLNLPVLTGTDTLAVLALAQTFTNKTIDADNNTITNIGDSEIVAHTSTKITITNKSLLNSSIVYTDQTNVFGDFNQDFKDNRIRIQNPAETFYYTLVAGAIAADRTLNLPVLTGTDTVAVLALAQTLTNKTINATDNTITDTSTALGDLFKSNGTKFVRFAKGSALQVLRTNAGGTDLEWADPSAGASDDVGIVQEAGSDVNVVARKLNFNVATDFTVADNAGNGSVDVKIADNAITDALITSHTSTKITITDKGQLNSAIVYNDQANSYGDFAQTFKDNQLKINNPADTFAYTLVAGAIGANRDLNLPVLTGTDTIAVLALAQTLTNKTIDANSNTISNINDDEIASHTSTKITITNKSLLNSAIVYNDQANSFGDFNQIFKDDKLQINNPADTFKYIITAGAIGADRILNLPVLTGTDTIAVLALAQTLTNKTIDADNNTITNIGDSEIVAHTSTKITITDKGQLNSAIAYEDEANNFGDFDNSFKDNRIRIWNPADTFRYTLIAGAIGADRDLNLPVLTGTDTIAVLALAQTFTNKTIAAGSNTITGIVDANIDAHTSTKITITAKGQLNSAIVYEDEANNFGDFDQTFKDDRLRIQNPAETFEYQITAGAIAADRILNLPVLTGTDTVAVLALAQTFTNKTIAAGSNTITGIVDANIDAHTSTKITITNKSLLNSNIAYIDQTNDFGAFTQTFAGAVQINANWQLRGDISPAQITADQHDYAPTGLSSSSTLRLSTDASRNITGIVGGADGRILILHNVGTNNIVLVDESASSTEANRFTLNANLTLGADQACILQYDAVNSRWRLIASSVEGAGGAGEANTASNSGVGGVGVWARKTSVDLEFKNINTTTGTYLTVTDDTGNDEIDLALTALVAKTDVANLFTEEQTIKKNTAALLKLFRDNQTTTLGCSAVFEFQDSAGNEQEFGRVRFESPVNTDGSESGQMFVQLTQGGTIETNCLQVNQVGNTIPLRGFGLDGVISPSQLTAQTDNWNPTGLQTASIIRVNTDSSMRMLTGITAPSPDHNKVLILRNISANTLLLCNQHADSSAANRFDFDGYDLPLFPKNEITLKYDITLDRWICEDYLAHVIPPSKMGFYYRNDCFSATTDGTVFWFASGTGTANDVTAVSSEANHPGVVEHETGTTSTGVANVASSMNDGILLGQNWYWCYEAVIRIPTLSTSSQRFGVDQGFFDNAQTGAPTDGCFAFVDDISGGSGTGQWELIAENNNVVTSADSSITPSANTWYKVKVVVYPDNTAELFIDGVSACVLTSGLPTGASRGLQFGSSLFKLVGNTERTLHVDYFECIAYAPTSR